MNAVMQGFYRCNQFGCRNRAWVPANYKEMTALAAQESGLDREFISRINADSPAMLHSLYLSTEVI